MAPCTWRWLSDLGGECWPRGLVRWVVAL